MKKYVELFTDGACSGNPGPGGWGAILRYGEHEKERHLGGNALVVRILHLSEPEKDHFFDAFFHVLVTCPVLQAVSSVPREPSPCG